MKKFSMWIMWLNVVCVIFVLFGLFLALFNQTSLFNFLFNDNINPVFWGDMKLSSEILHFQQWVYGVMGATCAGLGVIIYFIVNNAFKKKEMWAWNSILAGILMWFIFDEAISLYFKVYLNAIFNLALIISFFLPLIFTRRYFGNH